MVFLVEVEVVCFLISGIIEVVWGVYVFDIL